MNENLDKIHKAIKKRLDGLTLFRVDDKDIEVFLSDNNIINIYATYGAANLTKKDINIIYKSTNNLKQDISTINNILDYKVKLYLLINELWERTQRPDIHLYQLENTYNNIINMLDGLTSRAKFNE